MDPSREQVVAVFEPMLDQGQMVRMAIALRRRQLRPSNCCLDLGTPSQVAAQLNEVGATLVVWDVSPATPYACSVLETLLQTRTVTARNVVVTTTDVARLVGYLGAAAGGLRIFQKPYDIADLVLELERLGKMGQRATSAA
ncbi:MAG TPA: hypothetical protein VMF13_09345 [Luteitalea sp.]|nr:hypothetical protein [Luteitalea sp.]